MLKRASRDAPAIRNRKQMNAARLQQVLAQLIVDREGQKMESPDIGEQAGRNAEGDDVGQRIELFAELAGRVGHTRDAPVERVEGDGEKYG